MAECWRLQNVKGKKHKRRFTGIGETEKTPWSEIPRVVLKVAWRETQNWTEQNPKGRRAQVFSCFQPPLTQLSVHFSLMLTPCCTPMTESCTGSGARQLSPSICGCSLDPHQRTKTGAYQSKHGNACRGRADCENRPQRKRRALTRRTSEAVI